MNPNENQNKSPLVRFVKKITDENIVLEVFKNDKGVVVRSLTYTKDQVINIKKNVQTAYDNGVGRADELLALFD